VTNDIYSGNPELVDPYADVPLLDEEPDQATPSRLSTIRLSDVQPERVSWLWPGRIPAGKLVTLDGDPSLGKSTLSLAFAAIVTTGGTWPDNSPCNFPGDVILLSAEDGLADTVRPRLDAAGADVTRVHAVQGVTLPDGTLRPPTLADVDELHRLVVETGARLLVVDVLMAYLPSGTDSHKDQDIRRVLSRLSFLADNTGCTVLLLRHLNKAKGGDPMYRGGGSIGIVGAVRAGMLVAKDPDDEEIRVLACTKSNLGPEPEALTYRLTDADVHGVARVEWIGTSTHDARALLADRGDGDDEPGGNPAAAFIFDYLMRDNVGGEAPAGDVLKAGKAAGFSDNDLKHARSRSRAPRIVSRKAGMGGGWVWAIDTEGAEGACLSIPGTFGTFGGTFGGYQQRASAADYPDARTGEDLPSLQRAGHRQHRYARRLRTEGSRAEDGRRGVNTIVCTVCRTRLSLDDGTHAHPHCRGAAPLTDAEMTRLVAALGDLLGALPITPNPEPR